MSMDYDQKKLYRTLSVVLTPAPVRVPTLRLLLPSFMLVVGKAKNFSPCPRNNGDKGFREAETSQYLICVIFSVTATMDACSPFIIKVISRKRKIWKAEKKKGHK